MRIVVDYRPALRARTGVGEYVFQLVRALLERRVLSGANDYQLALFSSSWKDRPLAADVDQLRGADMVDRRIPVRLLNLLWHRAGWPPIETLAGTTFDVAFSPHPLLLPARNAAQVVMIHDLDFMTHPDRVAREIKRDYPALVRDHAARAHQIVVPSHYTARQVGNELGISEDRISVCYPGAPEWPAPAVSRDRDRKPDHILFFGTIEKRKNVGALLDAYAAVLSRRPDAPPLVLAGGAGAGAAEWLARLESPPLAGRVRYLGYVSEQERRDLFERAAVFVLPSIEEGFGMTVVEAMSAGVPVVVSDRGALPEVVGDAGVLVDPDDRDALSGAMERMLSDEGFRASAGAKGVQRARHFRWQATAEAVLAAFERAMRRRHEDRR